MKNTINRWVRAALAFGIYGLSVSSAFAQIAPTVLPRPEDSSVPSPGGKCLNLADKIRTGDIHLEHIACFIKYIAQTLIALGGTISVIMVMVGGYYYIVQGEEGKDKGKKSIKYALIGLAVTLSAWILVDLALRFATE